MNQSSHKMVVGVLSGTMQMILRHINDCRRQQKHVILPRLGNFVQYMSSCERWLECIIIVRWHIL